MQAPLRFVRVRHRRPYRPGAAARGRPVSTDSGKFRKFRLCSDQRQPAGSPPIDGATEMHSLRHTQGTLPGLAFPQPEMLDAGEDMSRALAAAVPERDRLALARAFGCRLVAAWWHALTEGDSHGQPLRDPPFSLSIPELPTQMQSLAVSVGRAAAALDPDTAAYRIGTTYTGMLPAELRAAQGIYYTPPRLAARLIAQASEAGADWASARVLDPACGGGAFLAPVAQRMAEALAGCGPRILMQNIASRLCGWELDPFGAWLSQVSLDAALLPFSRAAGCRLPAVVTVQDSLRAPLPSHLFDLVIGNPPYGRVRLSAADRSHFRRSLYGHANLYGLFCDRAVQLTRAGGVIAYVTPTSFLAGEYFKNLRALLAREAPPATIDFVALRKGVFDGVLQETLLVTCRRAASIAPIVVHEITPTAGASAVAVPAGAIRLPADATEPWLLPRTPEHAALVRRLAGMPHRLSDWGYAVSTGPLVWNRHKSQLARTPGRNRYPLIWAEAVTSDGRFIYRAERRNHTPYFELRPGDDWLLSDRICVLLQRTTAKEQARRLIAAALPADFLARHRGVIVENHLNMLRPLAARPAVPADVLAAFLNSRVADQVFRCASGSVAVSAYELEALPLPPAAALDELRDLVRRRAPRRRIEVACDLLYDAPR